MGAGVNADGGKVPITAVSAPENVEADSVNQSAMSASEIFGGWLSGVDLDFVDEGTARTVAPIRNWSPSRNNVGSVIGISFIWVPG